MRRSHSHLLLLLLCSVLLARQVEAQHSTAAASEASGVKPATQDILFRTSGQVLEGRILSVDQRGVRMEVVVIEGRPPGQVTIPKSDIDRIEFAPDPQEQALFERLGDAPLAELEAFWLRKAPTLAIEGSRAGEIGLAIGERLLTTGQSADRTRALSLFNLIENSDWQPERQSRGKGGRLKAMVLLDRADEALAEAKEMVSLTDDPRLLLESNFILGEAAFATLQKLVEENPRWQEDLFVRPEYARLFNDALDHYLFAPLFHGSDEAAATRGLWAAIQVLRFDRQEANAQHLAQDIVTLYPQNPLAGQARLLIDPSASASEDSTSAEPHD